MTDAMYKTNKACLSQSVGGDQVLQEEWWFKAAGSTCVRTSLVHNWMHWLTSNSHL